MPNDTTPRSPGVAPSPPQPDNQAHEAPEEEPGVDDSLQIPSSASTSDASPSEPLESEEAKAQRQRQIWQVTKRRKFLVDLLHRFDTLIFAEIAYLYYLEASLPRLLIRLFAQSSLLSPSFSSEYSGPRPYTQTLLLSNTICLLLHLFCALPRPQPGARGFLHGGIWPDFIGQRPPTSRYYLILLDIVVSGLQVFMLAVKEESGRAQKALTGKKEMEVYQATERGEVSNRGDIETGDLESAERGEVGRAPRRVFASHASEEQPLMPRGPNGISPGRPRARTNDSAELEEEERIEEPQFGRVGGALDEYLSGNLILGEFHVWHTIKDLWGLQVNMADQSLMAAGYAGGYYLRIARNRMSAAANAANV